ncbi:MAG TPA: FlgD immunoglobulin-like domain containing protein [Candidatus Kapabacteria bacterium]
MAQESETLPYPVVAPNDSGQYGAVNKLPESIRQSMPFAREFYEFSRHAGTSGTIDNNAMIQTFHAAQASLARSTAAANARAGKGEHTPLAIEGTWSNVGLTGGDTVPSAGITYVLSFDPQNVNIMYACGSGGLWKSLDTGATWTNLTDGIVPDPVVASVCVDPVNSNVLYIGTGSCNTGVPPYSGTGIYQSTDGGKSFQHLPNPFVVQNKDTTLANSFVKIVVDPANDQVVLASSFDLGHVFRSTNQGQTWTSVFTGLAWDILSTKAPNGATLFYLISSVDTGAIYKSEDHGATWAKASAFGVKGHIGRSALASPAKAQNKIFALMTDNATSSLSFLFESTDSGSTWSNFGGPSPDTLLFDPYVPSHPQGWYDLYLAVTPNSVTSDTIYVGGINAAVKQGSNGWELFSSTDVNPDGGKGLTHVDHHSIAINPLNSNTVYDGDDGGLWINYGAGSTDVANTGGWQLHSVGLISSRFYHLYSDKNNAHVVWAGAQDQGMWKITDDGKDPTHEANIAGQVGLGDAMQPIISSANPNLVFCEGPDGQVVKGQFSSNGSIQWTTEINASASNGWDNPLKMSPINRGSLAAGNILYAGLSQLVQSTNGGMNWNSITTNFNQTPDGVYHCSAIGLPNWNASTLYIAGAGSTLEVSRNFGTTWTKLANPGYVTSINTSVADTNFVIVTLGLSTKKVETSIDGGKTWVDVSGPKGGACIPGAESTTSCNVWSLAIDSTDPLHTWYAATDFGVYQTTDAGGEWDYAGPGLSLVSCRDIQVTPNGSTLRVATFGRGIWEATLPIQATGAVESDQLSAMRSALGTELSWNVQNEPAGATFYIERSIGGDAFTRIGSQIGSGSSEGTHPYSYADNGSAAGTYLYQIHEIDASGAENFSNRVELHVGTNALYLYEPYPNPYLLNGGASEVIIPFELPQRDEAKVSIYNVQGKLIRTLLDKTLDGGPQTAQWDARDNMGSLVSTGAYFFTIATGNAGTQTGKILVEGN